YDISQCEDNNSCTTNDCFSGRCMFNPVSNCGASVNITVNNQTNQTNNTNQSNQTIQCTSSTQCNDYKSCTRDLCSLNKCVFTNITSCISGDGCCASGCTYSNDGDCLPVCGNNIKEGNEKCDGTALGGATCAGVLGNGYTGILKCSNCLYNSSLCVAPCTQTCASLGYVCGNKTICGKTVNCGSCSTGFSCNDNGSCMKISNTNPNPNITNPTGDYWAYRKQLQRTTNLFSNSNVPNGGAWMHFQRGVYDSTSSRLYDSTNSYQNDGTGSIKLFYSGNENAYDRVVSKQGIPVEAGKTYTFSVMTKSNSWPPPVFYLQVFAADSTGEWVSNDITATGGIASNSKQGIWEESSIFFIPKPGTNYVGIGIGMLYEQQVEGMDRAAWFDDIYVGKGMGFKEKYEKKLAFNGSMTRVDDLGNIQILKNGKWTPFFPLAIFAHGSRPDWSIYSEQGFNMNIWAVDASQVQKAKLATSEFNPDGMLSGFSTSQYIQPYGWAYNDTGHMLDFINDLKSQGLMDEIVFYFQDNERNHGAWYTPEIFARIIEENDKDSQGRDMHPIYQLNGHPGVARKFNTENVRIADITGNYVGLGDLGTGRGTNGFILLDNYPGQRMPLSMAQMNTMGLEFRPSLYAAIAHGAKGMGYYWDNYPVPAERIENSLWWDDLPNIRREIDALMPLIVQPHWTEWTVNISTNSFIDYGTRMMNNTGYIIIANYDSTPASVTFTLNGLPYTPTLVRDYFTNTQITTISNSRFTVTIPAYGSGVYKLAGTGTTTPSCTNEAGCTAQGLTQCSGTSGYRICGNYDTSDSCLEWSGVIACNSGQTCSNGNCVNSGTTNPTGNIYYVATNGDDNNPGTITQPWKTWEKAFTSTSVQPGDTVYFRGGVYYVTTTVYAQNSGTLTKPIRYFNYPGETPILDGTYKTSSSDGLYFENKNNIHLKGLTIRNMKQIEYNDNFAGYTFAWCDNITVENCVAHDIGFRGFWIFEPGNLYFYNCDAYNCIDNKSDVPGNHGDGFIVWESDRSEEDLSSRVIFRDCRAWNNADDGWDAETEGYIELHNCWAFNQGYEQFSVGGNGFKLGLTEVHSTTLARNITNCIGANNRGSGFTTNDNDCQGKRMNLYNNLAYNNGWGFAVYNTLNSDSQELLRLFRNNIAYNNEINMFEPGSAAYSHDHNSWDTSGISVTDSDFVSLDVKQLYSPREADGSLPKNVTFGRLKAGSDLIDKGVNVGLPYSGNYPDLGAFESNY
ncbi:MAG: hypothetical protein ACP5NZ_02275, partial [Nanobdellota archaeon]